ncbi:MAG: hypothetical protein RMJ36_01345 [Candidatus Calescibacterium sp.]|nr:hypothetical protein [Candidatus Calescibacterium sp.]MDW8132285.1 hypothetical protein [Candidatus Calescibacterium sp.]
MNEKFWRLVDFLIENNDFYSKILKKVCVKSGDYSEIPFLTRKDIYEFGLSGTKSLVSKNLKIGYIFSTGGTTGKPKYVAYTFDEFELVSFYLSKCYDGIVESDVVANLFMAGNMWASFISVNRALEKLRCTILPISGTTSIELIKNYLGYFRPNCVVGIPTQIIQVVSEKTNFLNKVYYGGESFLENQIKFLMSIGCKIIKSGGYASVDADIIAYQCDMLDFNQHHIFTEHQFVEIIDIENGIVLNEKEKIGEVVVTNLDRYLCPIIRYRTGDLAKWVDPKCSCGRPTIELMGRFDDWIRLASYDFYYQDFAKALYPFQISLKINRSKSLVTILIENNDECKKMSESEIIEKLKLVNWQLKEGIEENMLKVEVQYVKQLPMTNKKINVIYE